MRRWHRQGDRYVCEWRGKPADPKKALRAAMTAVLGKSTFVRHHTRHSTASWLMQTGEDMNEIARFLGMTREVLEDRYGHLHPESGRELGDALTSGRAGRVNKPEPSKAPPTITNETTGTNAEENVQKALATR